jgi:hypothetical protein
MRNILIGIAFVLLAAVVAFLPLALAATNIVDDPDTSHWAWNDIIGWIDFLTTDNVNVLSQKLTGYADSSVGEVSLDCATSPSGNICDTSSYWVINDGIGTLSGWAWNDTVGWISFCGGREGEADEDDCPGSVNYGVLIDAETGDFSGWAWNDAVGWVSFNCADPGVCGTSSYKLATIWIATSTAGYLDSSTFDTGVAGGAQINSVIWHGSMPSPADGAYVGFQFAVATADSGPWNYQGPDGTSATYYEPAADAALKVDYVLHNNYRYFRYRTTIQSNLAQTSSPLVESVSVNWSR